MLSLLVSTDVQSFDDFAAQYDRAVAIEARYEFVLTELPTASGSVLEIGCGTGLLAQELSRRFRAVVAVDISAPMLAIARQKRAAPNIIYHHCDANTVPAGLSFDAIVSHSVFHHFADIPAIVTKLKTCLAPGGRLIIVDRVRRVPGFVPRWALLYRLRAVLRCPRDVIHHGLAAALLLFRFRCSRRWISHLQSDRYLSPAGFRRVYGELLPGAVFAERDGFMRVAWTAAAGPRPASGTFVRQLAELRRG